MAKAVVPPDTIALEALARAFADPAPRVLIGSGAVSGFFKGTGQAVKAAAKLCEERHWLEPTEEFVGKGKSQKRKYRLTPAGVQAVLDRGEPLVLLRSLTDSLQQQTELFRTMQQQLELAWNQSQSLADAVAQLTRKLQPPDVKQLLQKMAGSSKAAAEPDWLDDAIRLVHAQQQRDRFQPLSLPALFIALGQRRPGLTLGQFHDGLRRLREQQRVRLLPFTRALATIEDPRNAIFLDGEVMYYVELP